MKEQTVLILGGGVGGVVAANRLRKLLDRRHRVVLVDREPSFSFAASFLWVMTGDRRPEQVVRPLARLERKGIEVIRGEIERIDPARREAVVDGRAIPADHLIVAVGARFAPEVVPGLASAGHTFCTVEEARPFVRGDTALVTVMLAQNETGTLMPIAELAELARERGALVHTDAAQAVGKVQTRVDDLGVDLLSIAGHKLYAPKGVGALFVRRGTSIGPVLVGAGHERGLRPGTENVPFIVGLGVASELAATDLDAEASRQRALRDELWTALRGGVPGIVLNGHPTQRLPNTLNVSFPRAHGSAVLAAAPEIAASTGSACHEGGEVASSVLLAMGIDADTALGAVRQSLGRSTTAEQVAAAATALTRSYQSQEH